MSDKNNELRELIALLRKPQGVVSRGIMHQAMTRAANLLEQAAPEAPTDCLHDETHRAGAIWEVCDQCGMKWADDEGGKPKAAATTASASDVPLFGYFAFHDGAWHPSNVDDPCSVKLYRQEAQAAHAGAEKDDQHGHVMPPFAAPAGQQGSWVAVKDGTPSDTTFVAVFDPDCDAFPVRTAQWLAGSETFESEMGWLAKDEVSHWMLLPPTPDQMNTAGSAKGGITNAEIGKSLAAIATSEQKGPQA